MEDQAVGREVCALKRAQPVQGSQVNLVDESQTPCSLPFGPQLDRDKRRLEDGGGLIGELEEAEVEVLEDDRISGGRACC